MVGLTNHLDRLFFDKKTQLANIIDATPVSGNAKRYKVDFNSPIYNNSNLIIIMTSALWSGQTYTGGVFIFISEGKLNYSYSTLNNDPSYAPVTVTFTSYPSTNGVELNLAKESATHMDIQVFKIE